MQDIAGVRVVRDMDLIQQRRLVTQISQRLPVVRIDDRCQNPSFGYRALHLIAVVDGCPVEIQVRTAVQHAWAEVSEKLGDLWGRQIRYGGEPDEPETPLDGVTRAQVIDALRQASELIARGEQTEAQIIELQEMLEDPDDILVIDGIRADLRERKEELESTMNELRARLEAL
jgi:ppGpp synthetase/RelA/SpoT-type nucleotidyltranferase